MFVLIFLFNFVRADNIAVCEFYKDKSQELNCNNENYLMSFGYKYCRLFFYPPNQVSQNAINVFEHIRPCLINDLQNYKNLTCENTKSVAFQSHINCYVDNGFCELSEHDKGIIYNSALSAGLNSFAIRLAARITETCSTE